MRLDLFLKPWIVILDQKVRHRDGRTIRGKREEKQQRQPTAVIMSHLWKAHKRSASNPTAPLSMEGSNASRDRATNIFIRPPLFMRVLLAKILVLRQTTLLINSSWQVYPTTALIKRASADFQLSRLSPKHYLRFNRIAPPGDLVSKEPPKFLDPFQIVLVSLDTRWD